MKKKKILKAGLAVMLIMAMVVLVACSGNNNNNSTNVGNNNNSTPPANTSNDNNATTPANEPEVNKEPITMNVLFNSTDMTMEQTDVYQEIVEQTGVTMKIERYDEEKFKVQLAGGDLPDIIQVPTAYLTQLIEGNNIIPLDDLVQTNGPDVLAPVYEKSIAYMKEFKSNDTGLLYHIPIQIGQGDFDFDLQTGFVVRWDYYKELGFPEVNNIDDMVNILADMVKNHPTTEDGKKVYGVSLFNDWGFWGLQSLGLMTGKAAWGKANILTYDIYEQDHFNQYTDPEHSGIWETAYFLYKANQAGILDPNAFTDKYNDIVAKATQGTLISSAATWPFENKNAELLEEGDDKGFMTIPFDWGFAHVAGDRISGWGDKSFAITKNAENPERAMDLINFLVSEEGSRLIASGIEGVHWDMVDGKPLLKEETIKLAADGGDPWEKSGIGVMTNQQGLNDFITTSDGGIVRLFNTAQVYETRMNSLQKDFSEHYGVAYPGAIYKKYADEGKLKTNNDKNSDMLGAMQDIPEELKRTSEKLDDMILKGIPQVVLNATSDEDYIARQQQLIEELNEAGAQEVFDAAYAEYTRVLEEFSGM